MSLALHIVDPVRRGACPTLDDPMPTGDGLLARIKVSEGRLSPHQMADLAALAQTYGNGIIEVTARGNLQVRGLTTPSSPLFAARVNALLRVETGLVIDVSPIAGDDPQELSDVRPLARAIKDGVRAFEHRLGPKVSVVVDGSGQIGLWQLKADIRLVAVQHQKWSVTVGGRRPVISDTDGAIAITLSALKALAKLSLTVRAYDLYPREGGGWAARPAANAAWPQGGFMLSSGHTNPVALPFGAVEAKRMASLAQAADSAGVNTLRLAPDHIILFDDAPTALILRAAELGFVTRSDDPRRRIFACVGSAGCASGHMAARELASRLASTLPAGRRLHVSGCAKGCAHPRPADLVLVGRADGIGLVTDGRAGDTPKQILPELALSAALADAAEKR